VAAKLALGIGRRCAIASIGDHGMVVDADMRQSASCGHDRGHRRPRRATAADPQGQFRRHDPSRDTAPSAPADFRSRGGYLASWAAFHPRNVRTARFESRRRSAFRSRSPPRWIAPTNLFREQIEPLLGGSGVEFIGEINEQQKTAFLGQALALLSRSIGRSPSACL